MQMITRSGCCMQLHASACAIPWHWLRCRLPQLSAVLLVIAAALSSPWSRAATGQPICAMAEQQPLIIAHRGASGYLPEHTLEAYALAVFQGADVIEPDLVMSRDGVLMARHDNRLNVTTNVADLPQFAARRRSATVDGERLHGWFSEDFTRAELQQLRARERIPSLRPANARFDDQFGVPTLTEIIELVQSLQQVTGRVIGIYPELKHPQHFRELGLVPEPALVQVLHAAGYEKRSDPVWLQSFEPQSLRRLRKLTDLRLVQLIAADGAPADLQQQSGTDAQTQDYAAMATAAGLRRISQYADAVGLDKHIIVRADAAGRLDVADASAVVTNAHVAGLCVHAWTFRAENVFLPGALQSSSDPAASGDLATELQLYLQLGVDGFFVDQPDIALALWR